ncbi:MAG: 50S ribosomal protein L25 [Bacteroidales bacterium]|nr:50S ribosomal protein L25 [Candidatus Colimorpha merdihippi]
MRIVSLSGSLRENVGKKDAKALRREDKVPCVMYGKGEQYMFAVPQTEFQRILFNPAPCFVEIDLAGVKHRAMLKDIDFHPVTEIVYHCDFYELSDDKAVVMSIPVHTTGTSVGVMKGGKLVYKQKRLNVKALPANMPSEILIDITNLDIAQRCKVQDVPAENFTILNPRSSEVVVINSTRASATGENEVVEAE